MKIETSSGIGGSWIDKKTLKNGDLIKIKTEAEWSEGQNGKQLVAKMIVKGTKETVNVQINNPSKNALVGAFGDDSKNWMEKVVTVQLEPGIYAGKRGVMLNLVPDGYEVTEDGSGYVVILPKIAQVVEKEIEAGDIPF